MLRNELFKHKWTKYTPCALCLYALLSILITLSVSVVHASLPCADLISSSSKEQSATAHFGSGSGSESTSHGKNVLPPSSSSKDALGSSSTGSFLGSSSQSILYFYANSTPPKEGTKNFQSYIGELLEKKIIEEPQLTRFIENLEKGELINPISQDEALTSTSLMVQRQRAPTVFGKDFTRSKRAIGLVKSYS